MLQASDWQQIMKPKPEPEVF